MKISFYYLNNLLLQGQGCTSMIKIWAVLTLVLLTGCSDKSYEDYLVTAKQHIIDNKNSEAIISLKNAIQKSPKSAEARFILGKLYWYENQYVSAEKELNKALKLKYPASKIILLLSKIYHKNHDDLALLSLDHNQLGMNIEQKTEVAFYKSQAHLRLKQEKEARKLLEEIRQYNTTSPFRALAASYVLSADDNSVEALGEVNSLLNEHPDQGDALKLKAMLLLKKNEKAEAVNIYQQYTKIYPEDLTSQIFLARLLTVLNRTEEAEPIIDNLIKIYDNHMLLNQLKGVARLHAKDNKNALLYTEKAILQNPKDAALRLVAAYSAYQLKNCEASYNHLSVIADKIPPTHPAFRLLAICQVNLGLGVEASETLSLINEVSTQDAGLFSMVSLALINQGEILKAKGILNAAPTEGNSDDLTHLGILKLSLNEVSATINLEIAHEQDPGKNLTKTTLATVYLNSYQLDKALDLAKNWKKENTNDSQAYLVAGLAYIKRLDYEKAKIEFQQLLTVDSNNTKAKLLLIDVLDNLGEHAKAKADLSMLLKEHPLYVPALVKLYLFSTNKTEVIALMQSKVQSDPENIELILALAKILVAEGVPQKSVTLLTSIAEHQNKSDTYWDILGQAYMHSKQYNLAKRHYQTWLAEKPNNTFALIGHLVLMDLFQEYNEAVILTSNHLNKHGRDSQLELFYIHFLIKTEDFEAANQGYYRLSQAALELPFTKGLIGQIQMNNNNFTDALPNLLEAYNNLPNTQNVQLIYKCYYGLEQSEKSYSFLYSHVENYPQDLESLMQLAALQISINVNDSIVNYEKALQIAPENFIALNNLASFYLEKNQLDKAEKNASKALKLQPDHTYVLDTYGQILLAKKEYKNALTYFSKAVRDKNVIDDIYLNYIEALFLADQYALAQRKIEQRNFTSSSAIERIAILKKKYEA